MDRLTNTSTRLVVEACVVGLAWLLAGIAYLSNRHGPAGTLFVGGFLIVFVEFVYDMNTFTGKTMGGLAGAGTMRGCYLVGAVVFWGLALVVLILGVVQLVTGSSG